MDTLKYIELAKSKDQTRYNLTSVYRDKNHLVATDGHRLHMSNGLPDAKPHFLNGLDAEFPDYTQILPKTKEAGKVEYVHIGSYGKAILRTLKAISKLVETYGRPHITRWIFENDKPVRIAFQNSDQKELVIEHTIEAMKYQGKQFTIGVNLSYMIDALSYIIDTSCEIKIWSESSPIRIDSLGDGKLTAIVMPCRL